MDKARLQSVRITDFRSIRGAWDLPLDGDVVLLHGYNGAGKTSVLSAIELACTGRVLHLERAGDTSYQHHLNHRGTDAARVELRVSGMGAEVGTLDANARGLSARPLLDEVKARQFSERCYLPQATLSRLLELYSEQPERNAESSLVRFVKQLLGLDRVDAMIQGLDSTVHVSRAKKLSPRWSAALERSADRSAELRTASERLEQAGRDVEEARRAVAAALPAGTVQTASPSDLLAAARMTLATSQAPDRRDELAQARLKLNAAQSALRGLPPTRERTTRATTGTLAAAESHYTEWVRAGGQRVLAWAAGHRGAAGGREAQSAATAKAMIAKAIEEADVRGQQLTQARGRQSHIAEKLAERTKTVERLAAERIDVEARRSAITSTSSLGELSALLTSVARHVESDSCPVCDQQYATGRDSLIAHIERKARRLSLAADELRTLDEREREIQATLAMEQQAFEELKLELRSLDESVRDLEEVHAVAMRSYDELRSLLAEADRGALLLERVSEARSLAAVQTKDDAVREQVLSDLTEVAALIELDIEDGLELGQVSSILSSRVEERLRSANDKAAAMASLTRLVERLAEAEAREKAAAEARRVVVEVNEELQARLREAERRKEVASTLRKDLERVRAAVVGEVFTGQLNEAWASVFRALVPTEPFTPQFKVPAPGTRVASVELETVDPAGSTAASPAAMLSQGNLNTAALSLFVGLHFASRDTMPWLLFDDPVQSMDDLHVANFASLVKQLTRRHGRQVVLAVHQRELFEYLKLELTPAAPDQSLVAVSLDRAHGVTDVAIERVPYEPDDSLVGDAVA